jgi:ABC-2 type transport system ATP-binding protein
MNPHAIVRATNLSMNFGNVQAVDQVNLSVAQGEVFGFLGPNGAGKTTMIRLLLGLLVPSAGKADVLGYDTRTQGPAIRQHCGALLEHNGLYERLSAHDNLEFYGRVWRMPPREREARIQEVLTHIALWDRRSELVGNWSRGMKQKLAVARALLHRPPLIFLDEPTAGLDPVAALALREDLASLAARERVTIFLTTHNLDEAEKLCHRVGVIRKGKVLAVGTVEQLCRNNGSPHVEISGKGFNDTIVQVLRSRPEVASVRRDNGHLSMELAHDAEIAPLVNALTASGAQIEEVRKSKASLEDVFVDLIQEDAEGCK